MKRSPINRVSRRTRAKASSRRACCVEVRRRADGLCQAGPKIADGKCAIAGEHVHEIKSRGQGGDPTDPDNCLFVCNHCHEWTHTHPMRAAELGLLTSKKWGSNDLAN